MQNVVTYQTVIEVPNPELKLKPGMTATVNIEVARKNNVLRIPTAATRFRPNEEIFAALKQPVPPEAQGGRFAGRGGREGGRGGQPGSGGPGGTSAGAAGRRASRCARSRTGRSPDIPGARVVANAAGRRAGTETGAWHGRRIG